MTGGILFLVGLVGLVSASTFFAWETKKGVRMFERVRILGDRVVAVMYRTLVFGEIPHTYRVSFIKKVQRFIQSVVHGLVLFIRSIERMLVRMSHSLTYSQNSATKKSEERIPSPFLNDMKSLKKDGKNPDNRL